MTPAIDTCCASIARETEAMRDAELRDDADAYFGAYVHRDLLLDDLAALYRQRRPISTSLAPAV